MFTIYICIQIPKNLYTIFIRRYPLVRVAVNGECPFPGPPHVSAILVCIFKLFFIVTHSAILSLSFPLFSFLPLDR